MATKKMTSKKRTPLAKKRARNKKRKQALSDFVLRGCILMFIAEKIKDIHSTSSKTVHIDFWDIEEQEVWNRGIWSIGNRKKEYFNGVKEAVMKLGFTVEESTYLHAVHKQSGKECESIAWLVTVKK